MIFSGRLIHLVCLPLALWGVGGSLTLAQTTTPTAITANPGAFQPVARINPQQPITLTVINQTGATLEYGLTTRKTVARELQPSEKVTLGSLTLPAYLNISTPSRPPFTELSLRYRIKTIGNQITVIVTLKEDSQGDRVIDIDSRGGIYVY